jgi:HAD superfamily hydrolase (TIGR01549 family)
MLLLDIDNTLIPSAFAYESALGEVEKTWNRWNKSESGSFPDLYQEARKQVKFDLKSQPSNRQRILCFKKMWEFTNGFLDSKALERTLKMEEIYFQAFGKYLDSYFFENRKNYIEVFKLWKEIQESETILLLSNENLRTQILKLLNLFPRDIRFQILTSEEAGMEKPNREIFERALKKGKNPKKKSYIIGDSWEDDIKGGAALGLRLIHLKEMFGDRFYSESVGPPAGIQAIRVKNLIRGLEIFIAESLHGKPLSQVRS